MVFLKEDIGLKKIIDFHVHFCKWDDQYFFSKKINPLKDYEFNSYEEIINFISIHKLDRVVLVPMYYPDPTLAYKISSRLTGYAKKAKGKIIPGFWVDPSPNAKDLLNDTISIANRNQVYVLKISLKNGVRTISK